MSGFEIDGNVARVKSLPERHLFDLFSMKVLRTQTFTGNTSNTKEHSMDYFILQRMGAA